jgi:hypothetical protein
LRWNCGWVSIDRRRFDRRTDVVTACGPSAFHSSSGIRGRGAAEPPCLGQAGNGLKQAGNGRSDRGDSGGADEAGRRPIAPAPRHRVEQAIATIGQIDLPRALQCSGPVGQDQSQLIERFLPVQRQFRQVGGEAGEARGSTSSISS